MREDVTIVIPVYNALEETMACIASLLDSDAGDCRIIVNDDGSPVSVMTALRQRFADAPNVEVRSSFRNRGYTANVQFGVEAADTRYVAVVNSDTLFPRRWLGKLIASLESNPVLAAVGPLANAATFQSIPDLKAENGEFSLNPAFGLQAEQRETINGFLELCFGGLVEDVPILNGFCTLFRRNALTRIGGFNAQAFPTGYGEENDVCMRLMVAGYRLGVRLDTFVHHLKSKSFGAEKKKEYSRKGRETLAKLYGAEFVPAYAEVLDRNSTIGCVRFAVAAALSKQLPLRQLSIEPDSAFRFDGASEHTDVIHLVGPITAVIWPDLVEAYGGEAVSEIEVAIGAAYLRIAVPPGQALAFATASPIRSLLGVCGVRSSFSAVHVEMNPAADRSADIAAAIRELSFRHLYLDHAPAGPLQPAKPARPKLVEPMDAR